MKGKFLIALLVVIATQSVNAYTYELKTFLTRLQGTYVLETENEKCPQILEVKKTSNTSIEIHVPEWVSNDMDGNKVPFVKKIHNINGKISKHNLDFGVIENSRTRFVKSDSIITEAQICSGFFIKKCEPWKTIQRVGFKNDRLLEVKFNEGKNVCVFSI